MGLAVLFDISVHIFQSDAHSQVVALLAIYVTSVQWIVHELMSALA